MKHWSSCSLFSFLTLPALILLVSSSCKAQTVVYVSNDGISSSTCLNRGSSQPCRNLTQVLDYVRTKNSTTVFIRPGQYDLSPMSQLVFGEVENVLLASTEGVADIICNGTDAGLSFRRCHNVTIRGLSFNGCGSEHNSTSLNFTTKESFLPFHAALYFEGSSSISLDSISVSDSLGIAVQFFYTLDVTISDSNFTNNNGQGQTNLSGGVYIEFPYCLPGGIKCYETDISITDVSNSRYVLSRCNFVNNKAGNALDDPTRLVLPVKYYHVAFGLGGGLSLFFKGNAANHSVIIEDCTFTDNTAVYGGGLYIDMQDNSYNNSIIVRGQNVFTDNSATISGGGAYFSFLFLEKLSQIEACSYNIENVLFHNNHAMYGGGLHYLTTNQQCVTEDSINSFNVTNCTWSSNTAKTGAGLYLFAYRPVNRGIIKTVHIKDSMFEDNSIRVADGREIGTGALYTNRVPVFIDGSAEFSNTQHGSALTALQAIITFANNCEISFHNNSGYNGGAIALYSSALLEVCENTSVTFTNNTAINLGGAIYVEDIGDGNAFGYCFLQYYDVTIKPNSWTTTFLFTENRASGKANSIYVSSIEPCILGRGFGLYTSEGKDYVFCWNNGSAVWEYDSNTTVQACKDQIVTGPAVLSNLHSTSTNPLSIIPGKRTSINISAIDDQGDNVTSNLVLRAISTSDQATIDRDFNYISNNEIIMYQNSSFSNFTVHIYSTGEIIRKTELYIQFEECPPGLSLHEGRCEFTGSFANHVSCNLATFTCSILRGYWIGRYYNKTGVGHCRNCMYDTSISTDTGRLKLGENYTYTNEILCGPNVKGTLCSQCEDGFGPAINSDEFKCVPCSSPTVGIVAFIFLDIVAPWLLLALIILVDVPLTSGLLHGPILFAQMVTTVITLNGDGVIAYERIPGISSNAPNVIAKVYGTIYDIFNTEIFMTLQNYCLSTNWPYAAIISLRYFSAYLPLTIVGLVALVFYCHNRKFRVCLNFKLLKSFFSSKSKNVHNASENVSNAPSKSENVPNASSKFKNIPNALATFILLSYTKIAVITGYLLTSVSLWTAESDTADHYAKVMYFDGSIDYNLKSVYLKYFLLALIFGVPFILLVPIYLFCLRANDPDNNGGFFNHLLHQFQHELRDKQEKKDFKQKDIVEKSIKRKSQHLQKSGPQLHYEYTCCTDTELCSFKNLATKHCPYFYTKWSRYDYRWLAGGFFILRIALILPYMVAYNFIIQSFMQFTICMIGGIFIIAIRPYKRDIYKHVDPNAIEAGSLLLLALLIVFSMYQYSYTVSGIDLSTWAYVVQTILVWIPLVWMVIAYVWLLFMRYKKQEEENTNAPDHEALNNMPEEPLDMPEEPLDMPEVPLLNINIDERSYSTL